jgi:hypothetical protein
MIQETNTTEQANNIFQKRQAGIRKSKGIPVIEVFKFLVLLVFQGKNLYRFVKTFGELFFKCCHDIQDMEFFKLKIKALHETKYALVG